ncbi:IclR family transcriptional regulator [Nocardiopsis oceani]
MSADCPASRKTVPGTASARKVVQLLLSFSERRPRMSVAELSAELNITQATTYRYVALLKSLGTVEEGPDSSYQLTAKVLPMARAAQVVNSEARLARPVMEEMSHRLGETVMLLAAAGDLAVCVDRVESARPMRFTFEPGHSLPLGRGASGKLLLALLPPADRMRLLNTWSGEERTALAFELETIAEQTYAESFGEVDEGLWACSVPVRTFRPQLVLSVAGPESRIPPDDRSAIVASMKAGAGTIRDALEEFAMH